ncbi:UNVERIFIED_CONTAM: hypothetical protein FKN15_068742 [Acipenser sinensis]
MLAEIAGEFKRRRLNPPPAQSYAGPGDVPCDFCTGRKFKAVKSCLTCLASYCETHVKSHYEGAAFKRHKLVNAIGDLEQKLCAEQQNVLEVFCRTDQTCVCVLCTDKDHKNRDTVSAEAERSVKQKQLGERQTEIQQRIQERLKEIEELKQTVESLKRSACIEIKESEKIFTELIRSIEKIHTEVIELIGANEKAAVNQAEGRMKKLEQECFISNDFPREGLTGTRCYWEIEWSGEGADIGVTYKGIGRKGMDDSCGLGYNDKSWSLECSDSSYTALHNNNETAITAPRYPRIGVYLDFNAGMLSFYGVSDTMTLLHRFQTTFTEPLYPGFGLDYDSSVTICQLN